MGCRMGFRPVLHRPSPCRYAKDMTLRYNLRAMLGGKSVRLHLNNLYGKENAVITRMFIGAEGKEILPVTFGGDPPPAKAPLCKG